MKTSTEFLTAHSKLKDEVIAAINKKLTKKRVVFDDAFEDEANNELQAINKDDVFFNCDEDASVGGDSYPLHELGLLDAIYILGILEDKF